MTPDPSPQAVAAYVLGFVLTIPAVIALVKLIFFVASAHSDLRKCVEGIERMADFKHEARGHLQAHETRLTLVERDVEQLKDSAA